MKEKVTSFISSVRTFWNGISKKMRVVLLSVTAAILAISLAVVLWLNRSDYIVLYDNLSTSENAEVMVQLQDMGVESVLDGSKLMIPKDDENRVRMQLAANGYASSGANTSLYFDYVGMASTERDRKQAEVSALQQQLAATIRSFDEVDQATVLLAIPDSNNFALASEVEVPRATIKVQTKIGKELTPNQIQGIINIVRDSVTGLTEENISLADQNGDLLGTLRAGADATATKLELTEQVNETVKRRVMTLLSPVYGEENVRVAVYSVLDVDQRITETNEFIPFDEENPFRNPIDYWERERDLTGPGNVAEGIPGATPNTDVPEYAAMEDETTEADYYSDHEIVDYLVGSEKSQVTKEGYDIKGISVAVLISSDAAAEVGSDDRNRTVVMDLVAAASGVRDMDDAQTIDVAVQILPFVTAQGAGESGDTSGDGVPLPLPLVIAIGAAVLALVLIVVMVIIWAVRRGRRGDEEGYYDDTLDYQETTLVDLLAQDETFEPIVIPETNEQKLKAQIKDLATTDPEIVAQLLKTWLMEV